MRPANVHTAHTTTSWGRVADWYEEHLQDSDTYHAHVILPYVLRLFSSYGSSVRTVLEIGCGEGYFARALAAKGYTVSASDISKELIEKAKKNAGTVATSHAVHWFIADAAAQRDIAPRSHDVVLAVLTLQNMRNLHAVCKEVSRVLKPRGRFVFVLNHPSFRIPKASSWEYDGKKNMQYRRIEKYMSEHEIAIDMQPGKKSGTHAYTVSFHRPLSTFIQHLSKNGFAVTKLDELISHRTSVGPRAHAENTSRKEFPLFMTVEAQLL